jgi:glutathione S-transferase
MSADRPRLWHLPTSHFSEKVRWALEHKRIAHTRRVPLLAPHIAVARVLTRGGVGTFPVLELPGRGAVGDSTAIIAALEDAYPQGPLYPPDPVARERALALEEWFDAELGEAVRTLALHEAVRDPQVLHEVAANHRPPLYTSGLWERQFAFFLRRRYGLERPGAADAARAAVTRALDRLEAEIGPSGYLVGDALTVADVAAASHFYWLVQPPEGPGIVSRLPAPLQDFMAGFAGRDGLRWVRETYARDRRAGRDTRMRLPQLV